MQASGTMKKLINLEELGLMPVHEEITKRTPFAGFKNLVRFNMHLVLLKILLQHWYTERNNSSFELGCHSIESSIEDVALMIGLRNERIHVQVEEHF